jgi:hypothetical protein
MEIVLPSGTFAYIRKPTLLDMALAEDKNIWTFQINLLALLTTFDGVAKDRAEIALMDLEEMIPLLRIVNEMVGQALKSKAIS